MVYATHKNGDFRDGVLLSSPHCSSIIISHFSIHGQFFQPQNPVSSLVP